MNPSVSQAASSPLAHAIGFSRREWYSERGRNVAYSATISATTKYGMEESPRVAATAPRSRAEPRQRAARVPARVPTVRYTTAAPSTMDTVTGTAWASSLVTGWPRVYE